MEKIGTTSVGTVLVEMEEWEWKKIGEPHELTEEDERREWSRRFCSAVKHLQPRIRSIGLIAKAARIYTPERYHPMTRETTLLPERIRFERGFRYRGRLLEFGEWVEVVLAGHIDLEEFPLVGPNKAVSLKEELRKATEAGVLR